jgi:SRSO17 transposase
MEELLGGINQTLEHEYQDMFYRLGKVIPNEPTFQQAEKYIKGLLSKTERKNGWQISEYLGYSTPYTIQQFLCRGKYSADSLRDVLREYISDNLGEPDGTLVIDETGFLKQGKKSAGVARQYSGTAGRVENCQIGVFLTYASSKGHSPIDRRLYMPESWMEDPERCAGAKVPETLEFQTKPQMALEMIQSATAAGVPYQWVTGDSVYGDYGAIRLWLEQNEKCYVMSVSSKAYFWQGINHIRVSDFLKGIPEDEWFICSCGNGTKGERTYDWFIQEINPPANPGWKRWLLVRRSESEKGEEKLRAYICSGPSETPREKLREIA